MKKVIVGIFAGLFSFTTAYAEGAYFGFGVGFVPDALNLGTTITTTGIQTGTPDPDLSSSANCLNTYPGCNPGSGPSGQYLAIPESTLIGLDKATMGLVKADATEGPITALDLSAFWENEGENTFWRGGITILRKFLGGYSHSTIAGISWYEMNYDINAVLFPFYYGFKAGVGEAGSVYGGGGVNYYKGTATIGGHNVGGLPTALLHKPVGMNAISGGDYAISGPVMGETLRLTTEGLGFNFLIGVEKKTETGDKIYFEIERVLSAGYARDHAKTIPVLTAVGPKVPVFTVIGGTTYKFGYKMAM